MPALSGGAVSGLRGFDGQRGRCFCVCWLRRLAHSGGVQTDDVAAARKRRKVGGSSALPNSHPPLQGVQISVRQSRHVASRSATITQTPGPLPARNGLFNPPLSQQSSLPPRPPGRQCGSARPTIAGDEPTSLVEVAAPSQNTPPPPCARAISHGPQRESPLAVDKPHEATPRAFDVRFSQARGHTDGSSTTHPREPISSRYSLTHRQ